MKNRKPWFQLYPENNGASRLSIAGGGVKLLSIFLLIAAALYTAALLLPGVRVAAAGGIGTALLFVVEELEDVLFGVFFLWGAFAASRYTACVLQAKAQLMAQSVQIPQTPEEAGEMEGGQDALP